MVAGHRFGVTARPSDFALMGNYAPFSSSLDSGEDRNELNAGQDAFALTITDGLLVAYTEDLRQEEDGQDILCGHTSDGQAVFEFRWFGVTAGCLVCIDGYREARLVTTGRHRKLAIDNALMVLFALATADKGTALFHATVVSRQGRAYMFLGKSGTGKSTHARLWLEYIEGAELINDDNPVVRDGIVYGSPWSGKTPCYLNVSYPLGSIVLLSQAPYNKIRRLSGIEAYAALVPSISGKRWDALIANGLHQTENALAMSVPVWHLECLPDEGAARLCQLTIEK